MSNTTVDSQNETEIPDTQKYKNTQNHIVEVCVTLNRAVFVMPSNSLILVTANLTGLRVCTKTKPNPETMTNRT